jgi:FtsP/CotA-like multicopper oxidase with cupredoxin domain
MSETLTEIMYSSNPEVPFRLGTHLDHTHPDPTPQIMQGREGDLVLVNGELNPTFRIPRDGLLRLRFLNASVARYYQLHLEDHPMYLIATDGGPIAEPFEMRKLLLAPGERAEVLVRGERSPGISSRGPSTEPL